MAKYSSMKVGGLTDSGTDEALKLSLEPGCGLIVYSPQEDVWTAFLDSLLRRRRGKSLPVEMTGKNGKPVGHGLESAAVVPPPGHEVFVGTTVGEQLDFYSGGSAGGGDAGIVLDEAFGFGFLRNRKRSVWELGEGERRCLLTVSQALAEPSCWLFYGPLECLDGVRRRAMAELIRKLRSNGEFVIAGTAHPDVLLGCCGELLVLDKHETEVIFHGAGRPAAEYLAGQMGLDEETLGVLLSGMVNY